ncbi:hypothetical protein T484DRAFT_1766453 [Baffinella frigidus]|nr:hypothetical protein T484DRAFT_1766453 [Cryptophyta sp. CCMP2293]
MPKKADGWGARACGPDERKARAKAKGASLVEKASGCLERGRYDHSLAFVAQAQACYEAAGDQDKLAQMQDENRRILNKATRGMIAPAAIPAADIAASGIPTARPAASHTNITSPSHWRNARDDRPRGHPRSRHRAATRGMIATAAIPEADIAASGLPTARPALSHASSATTVEAVGSNALPARVASFTGAFRAQIGAPEGLQEVDSSAESDPEDPSDFLGGALSLLY